MIILNTTFIVGESRLDEFCQWARHTYLPAMELAGIFTDTVMARITSQIEPGTTSVAIQGRTATMEAATRWHDDTASILRDDLVARFNGQALFFTTYMETID